MEKKETEKKESAEKYFDPTVYNTLIVSANNKKDQKKYDSLLELISDNFDIEKKEEIYKVLKKPGGKDVLIEAIKTSKGKANRNVLFAACWETNLDFSEHLELFVNEAIVENDLITIEATTVIEEMAGEFSPTEITSALSLIDNALSSETKKNKALLENLSEAVKSLKTEGK